jgi:hypothetical protein
MLVRDSASTSVCLPILQRPMLRLQARAWPYCRLYSMQEQLKPTQEEPFEPVKQAQGTKGNRARDKKKSLPGLHVFSHTRYILTSWLSCLLGLQSCFSLRSLRCASLRRNTVQKNPSAYRLTTVALRDSARKTLDPMGWHICAKDQVEAYESI